MSSKNKKKSSTTPQLLTQEEIAKLSQDPSNRVYQYQYDQPTKKYTSQEQKDMIIKIRTEYVKLVKEHPNEDDVQIRQRLKSQSTEFYDFWFNMTKVFDLFTHRNAKQEHLMHVNYMLYLREQLESGNLQDHEAQEAVQNYLVEQLKTGQSVAEYREQVKKEKEERKLKTMVHCPHHSHLVPDYLREQEQEHKSEHEHSHSHSNEHKHEHQHEHQH